MSNRHSDLLCPNCRGPGHMTAVWNFIAPQPAEATTAGGTLPEGSPNQQTPTTADPPTEQTFVTFWSKSLREEVGKFRDGALRRFGQGVPPTLEGDVPNVSIHIVSLVSSNFRAKLKYGLQPQAASSSSGNWRQLMRAEAEDNLMFFCGTYPPRSVHELKFQISSAINIPISDQHLFDGNSTEEMLMANLKRFSRNHEDGEPWIIKIAVRVPPEQEHEEHYQSN